jgi:hypothetical protein
MLHNRTLGLTALTQGYFRQPPKVGEGLCWSLYIFSTRPTTFWFLVEHYVRKAPAQIFASHLGIAHTSRASIRKSYATLSHEESNDVGRWYGSFKAGKTLINRSHDYLMKYNHKLTRTFFGY